MDTVGWEYCKKGYGRILYSGVRCGIESVMIGWEYGKVVVKGNIRLTTVNGVLQVVVR